MSKKQCISLIIIWVAAISLAVCAGYVTLVDRGYTEVCFLDVGQGDSCYIRTELGSSILIDGGDVGSGNHVLDPFLRKNFALRLNAVFLSHIHADHIRGIVELLNKNYPIDIIYISENANTSGNEYDNLINTANNRGITVQTLSTGSRIDIDELSFTVAASGLAEGSDDDENDNSMVIRMDCGENSFLFTGDATKRIEGELKDNDIIDTDFLKVGHHGSSTSSTSEFLSKVSPELAVISVGEKNKYKHPSKTVLNTLNELNMPMMRTDYDGTITIIMTADDIRNIRGSRERSAVK